MKYGYKNLADFISELRIHLPDDNWGTTMECWFESVGNLWYKNEDIPVEWKYSPGMTNDPRNSESYWHVDMKHTKLPVLWDIAKFCSKYAHILDKAGKSY